MIIRYPSISAVADDFERKVGRGSTRYGTSGSSWMNGETTSESIRKCRYGDTSLVPLAEAELDKLDQVIETPRLQWDRSPAGAFCSVPDYIVGLPTPMRRQIHINDEKAPINIVVDVGSSASVQADTLKKRGITILALVMALSRTRPVMLYPIDVASGNKDRETIWITQINTTPLDLATACYVLTSAGFSRGIIMPLEERINGNSGGWPAEFGYYGDSLPYYKKRLPLLGFVEKDTLIIPASKGSDELVRNPIPWINKQITRFTTQEEEEEEV